MVAGGLATITSRVPFKRMFQTNISLSDGLILGQDF